MNNSNNNSDRTVEIDQGNANTHCLTLLASIEDTPEPDRVTIQSVDSGVWNNIVLEVTTPKQSYYYKEYRKLAEIPNYSPPDIPAKQRAQVAQIAQAVAADSFVDSYRLVPTVLAMDETAFIMEAIPQASHLITYLSSGRCPEQALTVLPSALARFHNDTFGKDYSTTSLSDTRFRDYKLDLQYYGIARSLSGDAERVLKGFADAYKQRPLCIVHGDLNSKNILIRPDGAVHVIDFEQAHLGTPAYDLAFILSEMFIASLQFKQHPGLRGACQLFVERYLDTLQGYNRSEVAREATIHLAAQVIYRFNGPSAKVWTSYVEPETREEVLNKAIALIDANMLPLTAALAASL